MSDIVRIDVPTGASIGQIAEAFERSLIARFAGQQVLVRCISSADHPGLEREELLRRIAVSGTDKYDPGRSSVAADYYSRWEIDFFATALLVGEQPGLMREILDDFAVGALEDRGHSVSIDIALLYDPGACEMVSGVYEGHAESDAFRIKNPEAKRDALLAVLVLGD